MNPSRISTTREPVAGISANRTALLSTAVATLAAALVLLPLLGHKPLAEWDEGIYAEISREMLTAGWLTPHWNQQLWLEKPPLLLWITAAFFKLFAVDEFWTRAASALSGIAIVTLLHGWLFRRYDALTAWLSTIILLSTLGFLRVCRVGETDVLLSLGCTVALVGLSRVDEATPPAASNSVVSETELNNSACSENSQCRMWTGWMLFFTGFAVAVMTKGAAALTLPISALVLAIVQRWPLSRFRLPFSTGVALFLLLVLPWHLAMLHLYGSRFLAEYLGLHILTRATQPIENHLTPWWYYAKVLLISAPPFALLYPVALVRGLRRSRLRVWAIFALVVLLCFTLVRTRLPHYIAPAYPALALLTAVWISDWIAARLRPDFLQAQIAPGRTAEHTAYANSDHTSTLRGWKLASRALAACVFAAVSILATAPARRSLHSGQLPDGSFPPDNKDAVALLRSAFAHPQPIPGPLLVWQQRAVSVSTDVFYSRRPIQQVEIPDILTDAEIPFNRYTHNPLPLDAAVTTAPRLILLDRALLPRIPAQFSYTPIQANGSVELGAISLKSFAPHPTP